MNPKEIMHKQDESRETQQHLVKLSQAMLKVVKLREPMWHHMEWNEMTKKTIEIMCNKSKTNEAECKHIETRRNSVSKKSQGIPCESEAIKRFMWHRRNSFNMMWIRLTFKCFWWPSHTPQSSYPTLVGVIGIYIYSENLLSEDSRASSWRDKDYQK